MPVTPPCSAGAGGGASDAATDRQTILALVIEPDDRAGLARLHAAGLLGFTGVGWLVAAAYCLVIGRGAAQRREALPVLQAGQAALFQLGAGAVLFVILLVAFGGFLLLGGTNEFLPELPVIDPFSAGGITVLVLWLVSLVALPLWHVWSLRQVIRAWRRTAAGELYAYPFVGSLVWEEAPRLFKWMVIRDDETAEEEPIESGE